LPLDTDVWLQRYLLFSFLFEICTRESNRLLTKNKKMAEELNIIKGTKEEQYEALLPQIKAIVEAETDVVANLANICAMLKSQFNWLWVGFYLVKQDELVLGPFQGPLACTRIQKGKGVCGTSWQNAETIVVPDVEQFPGHIACSSDSKSEIVVPVLKNGAVAAVLDVDSEHLNYFDATDRQYLEQLSLFIAI
jgi:L-methionine (R)-S-oxide reductase